MYSDEELKLIQDTIEGKLKLSNTEMDIIKEAVPQIRAILDQFNVQGDFPYALSIIGLFAKNKELYDKIISDEKAQKIGIFAFFPESYDMIYNSETFEFSSCGRNRGTGIILKNYEKSIVIKPFQSHLRNTPLEEINEIKISKTAENIEMGPKQYTTLNWFISEEFIQGTFFNNLDIDTSQEKMYVFGKDFGKKLKLAHENNIFYNDTTVMDDYGHSHLIVLPDDKLKLIDFGTSVDLSNHPNYTDEQVINYVKTTISGSFFLASNPSQDKLKEFITHNKSIMNHLSKEDIFHRDVELLEEGLGFSIRNFGARFTNAFAEGFLNAYK